ncbi:RICIN domain-containing protein [Micromonospora sp. NPDC049230]|uniref:RICIN domain-containing protein n=1 Tax=Micromonospora sp. NPDC049230 TaxID=3155502 RepID=UPI00340D44E4
MSRPGTWLSIDVLLFGSRSAAAHRPAAGAAPIGLLTQQPDTGSANQQWRVVEHGGDVISLVNRQSGLAMDVWERSTPTGPASRSGPTPATPTSASPVGASDRPARAGCGGTQSAALRP